MKRKLNKGKLVVYPLMISLISAPIAYNKLVLDNNQNRLQIISAYNDNNGYHPKVLNFKEPWNGYKYYMAYTPYTDCDDVYENPHIMVSNDMINWKEKEGFNNPLEPVPENHKNFKVYNSDTHLVYNDDNDELECWWRLVDDINDLVYIKRKVTKDGTNWSESENMYVAKRSEKDILSPSILYKDGIYTMYGVGRGFRIIEITTSDLKTWSEEKLYEIPYTNEKLKTWHIDVIDNNGKLELLSCAFIDSKKTMNLYYTSLEDGKFKTPTLVLTPSNKILNWDDLGIYRSSLVYENGQYYIFYSANSKRHTQGIGMVKSKVLN